MDKLYRAKDRFSKIQDIFSFNKVKLNKIQKLSEDEVKNLLGTKGTKEASWEREGGKTNVSVLWVSLLWVSWS